MRNYDDIAACAVRYAAARAELAGDIASLGDYEAVLRTRVALAECLIAGGWLPPEEVQQLLALDRQLLAEPPGAMEGDSPLLSE
jgi:hypothetical protein